ncbi:MAG: hypothetical protein RM338_03270, partial [Nostoc sp. DedQUE12a]|nr:hypothetical protein [Nostoc sp. DedQUE12a]
EGRGQKEERIKLQKALWYKGYRMPTSQEKSSSLIWIFVTSSTTTGKILKPLCLLPPAFCLKARNFSSSPKADNNLDILKNF